MSLIVSGGIEKMNGVNVQTLIVNLCKDIVMERLNVYGMKKRG